MMRWVAFRHHGREQIGLIEADGRVYPLAAPQTMIELIESPERLQRGDEALDLAEVQLLPPVMARKIIGVGRNYADHAAELGNQVPEKPLLFAKFSSALIGDGMPITWRAAVTTRVDWEGELAVIIGKAAREVSEADAMGYVFGYTIGNDVSARDLQQGDGQWARAKGLDTFCPLGPWIVTADEIPDPYGLTITTRVNEVVMQQAGVGEMIFRIPALIAHCSQAFTLQPGDVILTGTPAGVGNGMKPPRFLADGDVVSVTIDGIGTLTNPCHEL